MTRGRKSRMLLHLPDIHYPHQHEPSLEVARKIIRDYRPDWVVQSGDMLDCAAFSSHASRSLTAAEAAANDYLRDEVEPARELMSYCVRYAKRVDLLLGNHEARIEARATENRALRSVLEMVEPSRALAMDGLRITPYTASLAHLQLHEGSDTHTPLVCIHGSTHAKHAAATTVAQWRTVSVVHGHTHRKQSYTEREALSGREVTAWSPGCLSELQPFYSHSTPTTWTRGVSVVYLGRRSWTHYIVPIVADSCVMPDGRVISA